MQPRPPAGDRIRSTQGRHLSLLLPCVLMATLGTLGACSERSAPPPKPAAPAAEPPPAPSPTPSSTPAPPPAATSTSTPAHDRLMAAIKAGPAIPEITAEGRLAHWSEMVERAMPNAPERDQAFLAQRLALAERLREQGIGATSDLGELHLHTRMLDAWRDDTDGDGRLSADELAAALTQTNFHGEAMQALASATTSEIPMSRDGPLTAADVTVATPLPTPPPELLATADTDRDGALSESEWRTAAAEAINQTEARERFMTMRIAAHTLDADNDGSLGPAEINALESRLPWLKDTGASLNSPWISPIVWTSIRQAVPELGWSRPWEIAPIIEQGAPLPEINVTRDVNGDGTLDMLDALGTQEAVDAYFAGRTRRYVQGRFAGLVQTLDSDADGALSQAEWESGHQRLPELEARRRFAYFYDSDNDATIGDAEISRFMDWYEARGLRADANFDGVVDSRDAAAFMEAVRSGL